MSGETEVWRPGAEPWEALQEADRRYDNTPEPRFARVFWEGIAARLSGMGWRLAPAYRGEGKTGAEIMADPPEWPVPEEPEGEKALRFLRELRQYLDRRLRKYGDGDLSDYEVGCKQELEGVSTWLAEFEAQPAPVPVEEPEGRSPKESYVKHVDTGDGEEQDRHNSAPEIKVGQVWRRKRDGYTARVKEIEGTTVWLVDVAIGRGGGVWLRLSQFPDEGSRPFTDDYVRTYFDVVYDPPDRSNPSLDLEGLAKLDAEIADLRKDPMAWRGEPDWAARQVRIDALSMARNWLVSTPSEEAENDE